MTTISDTEPQAPAESVAYETCEQCDSPVESTQRYCVVCGTHRRHVPDPAARFHASATSRHQSATRAARGPAGPRRRSFGLGTALAIALIPLAVAAGVLIGHSGNDSNSKLIAALRAQKPTVVNVGGGSQAGTPVSTGTGAASSAAAAPVASTFSLKHGYAVELQTLPANGTTQATATAAEAAARSKGASAVGLIRQADFKITPQPPGDAYVIYSGQYSSSSAATSALGKLKHAFPSAKVISVSSASSGGGQVPGKVLSSTAYGTAHQIAGYKPTASQEQNDGKIVNQISKEINSNYTKSQQGLPDAISVP
jgi:hypothetical protein